MSVDARVDGGSLGFSTKRTIGSAASVSAIPYCVASSRSPTSWRGTALAGCGLERHHSTKRGSEKSKRLSPAGGRQGEAEQIAPGGDDELVVFEPRLVDREPEIPHRAEPVLVRRGPVV